MAETSRSQGKAVSEVRQRVKALQHQISERRPNRKKALEDRIKALEDLLEDYGEAIAFMLMYIRDREDEDIELNSAPVGLGARKKIDAVAANNGRVVVEEAEQIPQEGSGGARPLSLAVGAKQS